MRTRQEMLQTAPTSGATSRIGQSSPITGSLRPPVALHPGSDKNFLSLSLFSPHGVPYGILRTDNLITFFFLASFSILLPSRGVSALLLFILGPGLRNYNYYCIHTTQPLYSPYIEAGIICGQWTPTTTTTTTRDTTSATHFPALVQCVTISSLWYPHLHR